jgi:phosphohistidine phosphatase SixA
MELFLVRHGQADQRARTPVVCLSHGWRAMAEWLKLWLSLILIRHGQADSAGENYDQLTETGHAQARRVGVWLAANGYQI